MNNTEENYIDGFVFPIQRKHLNEYKKTALKIAEIWKEYGALADFEYVGEELQLEGTRSFIEAVELKKDELVVFGWVLFSSKKARDLTNKQVPNDPRIKALMVALTSIDRLIFDASKMNYGGFHEFI